MKPVRQQTAAELEYNRRDLHEVIQIQEKAAREGSCRTPKLSQYWDELHEVVGEISRRQQGRA